jgi:uncharacterized protein (DUF433 family)
MTDTVAGAPELIGQLDLIEDGIRQLREMLIPLASSKKPGSATEHPYIERKPGILSGEPIIKGTRTPVRAIVEHWKFGDSPDVIIQHLPYLRLAQVFDALGYYNDHPDEIEHYIALNQVPVDG